MRILIWDELLGVGAIAVATNFQCVSAAAVWQLFLEYKLMGSFNLHIAYDHKYHNWGSVLQLLRCLDKF